MSNECTTCLECKHLGFTNPQPDYSEYTPGHSGELNCQKSYWVFDAYNDDHVDLRQKLYTSRTCKDFEREETA